MMTDCWITMGQGLVIVCVMMTCFWGIAFIKRNAGWVDLGWAVGLALLAVYYAQLSDGNIVRRSILAFIVVLWAFRLGGMLLRRLLHESEDKRYQKIRASFGSQANLKFFLFFQFQAVLDVVLSIPFWLICFNPQPELQWIEWIAIGVWILGFVAEALADAQLKAFKSNVQNKGKVCEAGLWNYSRHPNYFFEWVMWVGYFLFAMSAPYGWVAIVSPLLMLYFLLKVSGVPLAEEQSLVSRGDAFRKYQTTTSVFIPLPKRKL